MLASRGRLRMDHLQVERFSRPLLGDDVPAWPIEDARNTLALIGALVESGCTGGRVEMPSTR